MVESRQDLHLHEISLQARVSHAWILRPRNPETRRNPDPRLRNRGSQKPGAQCLFTPCGLALGTHISAFLSPTHTIHLLSSSFSRLHANLSAVSRAQNFEVDDFHHNRILKEILNKFLLLRGQSVYYMSGRVGKRLGLTHKEHVVIRSSLIETYIPINEI